MITLFVSTLSVSFWVLLFIFFGLLVANIRVFLRRDWEESYFPRSYQSLYTPLDIPTLRRWTIESSMRLRPEIIWNRTPDAWEIYADGQLLKTDSGKSPVIDLIPKKDPLELEFHHYLLRPLPKGIGPDLVIDVRPISRELYERQGMSMPKDIFTVKTQVVVGRFRRYPVQDWIDSYSYVPESDRRAARRLVLEEGGILPADDTLTRMRKLMLFFRKKLGKEARGIPKDAFRWMTPWQIYLEMSTGRGHGYCTQFAQMYVFFATMADIPTRLLSGANTEQSRLYYTGHTWAECFVHEEGRWVYTDPTHAIIAVRSASRELINSADILNLSAPSMFADATALIVKDWEWAELETPADEDGVSEVPFADVGQAAIQESPPQAIIKYRRPPFVEDIRARYGMLLKSATFFRGNVLRYWLRPSAAYSLMSTDGPRVYLLRRGLLVALVISGVLLFL